MPRERIKINVILNQCLLNNYLLIYKDKSTFSTGNEFRFACRRQIKYSLNEYKNFFQQSVRLTNFIAYGTRIHKGSPIIPILSRINPILRIVTYLFKVHSNIIFSSMLKPP